MRAIVRTAGITTLGAVGALLWLATVASAQVGSPTSEPFTPYSPTDQPAIFIPESSPGTTAPATTTEAPAPEPVAEQPAPVAAEAPAPEPALPGAVVESDRAPREASTPPRAAPKPVQPVLAEAAPSPERSSETSVAAPAGPVERVKTVLAELASACKIGVSFPTGGPVLAFAVLAAALGLDGQRFQRARWPVDEDAPELLYAGDVIAPG